MKYFFTLLTAIYLAFAPVQYNPGALLTHQPLIKRVQAATDIVNDGTLGTNLVACWELDETSGTRVDSTGTHNLTDNNTVLSGTGIIGNGADFEKANTEYLSKASPGTLAITGDLSVSWWYRMESTDAQQAVMGNYGTTAATRGYFLAFDTATALRFNYRNSADVNDQYSFTIASEVGNLVHYVYVFDASAADHYLYKNGSLYLTGSSTRTDINASTHPWHMGAIRTGGTFPADGIMDVFAISTSQWGAAEAAALYNGGSGIPCVGAGGGAVTPIFRPDGLF